MVRYGGLFLDPYPIDPVIAHSALFRSNSFSLFGVGLVVVVLNIISVRLHSWFDLRHWRGDRRWGSARESDAWPQSEAHQLVDLTAQ